MMLSFSVPSMRQMVVDGARQRAGENVGDARVKRQTIRGLGPRNRDLLERARANEWRFGYDLTLWWKSRTPQRCLLAEIKRAERMPIFLVPIRIEHRQGCSFFLFVEGFCIEQLAKDDGFENPEAFRDFFVPNPGDRFEGVLFKW